jgi:hypothetical protein
MLIVSCFFFASSSPSLFLRYKSVSSPFLRIGENGTYIGFTREEEGSYIGMRLCLSLRIMEFCLNGKIFAGKF